MQGWLLTSFETWLPHQASNTSDDLLLALEGAGELPEFCNTLRKLPVNTCAALKLVKATIQANQSYGVLCCGMAESRSFLNLEVQAFQEHRVLQTNLNPYHLAESLSEIRISYDAGRFVCNDLYYALLESVQQTGLAQHVLFVHVPDRRSHQWNRVVRDFRNLLWRLPLTKRHFAQSSVSQPRVP